MSMSKNGAWRFETETQDASRPWTGDIEPLLPALTILAHPDRERVGERALLGGLLAGREARISRGEPLFAQPGGRKERPLGDARISRSPIRLIGRPADAKGNAISRVSLRVRDSATVVELDGRAIDDEADLPFESLEHGVVLSLSFRVVVLLHLADPLAELEGPDFGLIGASDGIARVRSEIRRLANLDLPILLRGETGTGKELVASALHRAGARAEGPFIALNMAAIPPPLAAAELFGATKGAYTGATRTRRGAFQRADGGTLFLDEIGDTPEELQALLLRTLESREILPVGAERPSAVDVRLVTATDLDLENAIQDGRFRSPLLYRLAGFEIELPPLRARREDIGRLFFHFLEQANDAGIGENNRETTDDGSPWPSEEIVARIASRPWPGNVRQLRNAARQLAVLGPGASSTQLARWLEQAGQGAPASSSRDEATPVDTGQPPPIRPGEIREEVLIETLRRCRYRVLDAARELGISRGAVYKLIDRSPRIRKAGELERSEIQDALDRCAGDLAAMVDLLEVSAPALRRRMRQLGFT